MPHFLCGNRHTLLDIEKYTFYRSREKMPIIIREKMSFISIFFSCYYQAFTLKLELIGIDLFLARKRIDYD
jgi:hypothetical protein